MPPKNEGWRIPFKAAMGYPAKMIATKRQHPVQQRRPELLPYSLR
jgi:hypothetical protein